MTDDEAAEALLAVLVRIDKWLQEGAGEALQVTKKELDRVRKWCPPELRYEYQGDEK